LGKFLENLKGKTNSKTKEKEEVLNSSAITKKLTFNFDAPKKRSSPFKFSKITNVDDQNMNSSNKLASSRSKLVTYKEFCNQRSKVIENSRINLNKKRSISPSVESDSSEPQTNFFSFLPIMKQDPSSNEKLGSVFDGVSFSSRENSTPARSSNKNSPKPLPDAVCRLSWGSEKSSLDQEQDSSFKVKQKLSLFAGARPEVDEEDDQFLIGDLFEEDEQRKPAFSMDRLHLSPADTQYAITDRRKSNLNYINDQSGEKRSVFVNMRKCETNYLKKATINQAFESFSSLVLEQFSRLNY
jgi:hypothetical protein